MKYLLLLLMVTSASVAQVGEKNRHDSTSTAPNAPVYGLERCGEENLDYMTIADFTKKLKSGELVDAKDLVSNPNFLNPCFKEQAGIYSAAFDALNGLSNSISTYAQSELNNINKVNAQHESLGSARNNKPKSKPATNAPTYTSSFINFKKKASLVATIKNETGFIAHFRYGDQTINDVVVGNVIKGVKITSIEPGRISYKDTGASGRTANKWAGG